MPLGILIAIWSVSAIVSLPGLAISPILGDLDRIFPKAGDLEIQMLGVLPSLLIIPFVLLAGKLSVSRSKLRILYGGLGLFFVSGLACLPVRSMAMLIALNCALGIGAGMVIPLSKGMIADYFTGKYRVKQLGISSSISNVTMVLATSLTGWLATIDWHYPFLVYLLPGVSLLLTLSLRKYRQPASPDTPPEAGTKAGAAQPESPTGAPHGPIRGIDLWRLAGLMLLYFFATYAIVTVPIELPFLMQHYGMDSSVSGLVISLFFLAIMLPGFFIDRILGRWKERTIFGSVGLIAAGLALVFLSGSKPAIISGCFATGFGYGIIQPLVYNKAVVTAVPAKATLALALVMSVNYLAILLCPFIVDLFALIFDALKSSRFPFLLNAVLAAVVAFYGYRRRNRFAFGYVGDELK